MERRPVVARGGHRGRRRLLRGRPRRPGGRPAGAARHRDGLAARPPRRDRRVPGGAALRRRPGLRALDRRAGRRRPRRRRLGRPAARGGLVGVPGRARRGRRVGALRRALPPRPAQGLRRPHAGGARGASSTTRSRRSPRRAWPSSARPPACASRCGELYPEPALLARFRAAGVPATLSSDAHAPEDVARDYPTAVAALRGAGYETITRFSRREPSQAPIRWA